MLSLLLAAGAGAQSAEEIRSWLADVDHARNAFGEAVITARATELTNGERTGGADFEIYTKGQDRGLIIFRGGKNDGRKILNVGEKMWLIVPGASRALPITPNQRLLGGASVGDVARVEFSKEFDATPRPEAEKVGSRTCRVLDLAAKSPSAPYPRVVLWFDPKERVPCRLRFSLPSGKESKDVTFLKFRRVSGRAIVSEMGVRDLLANRPGTMTVLEYLDYRTAKLDPKLFTPEGALNF
jgi:Outer membrane lipoprotein-sorting protein